MAIVIILVLYALFLAGFTTQNSRFLLITFPFVIILYAESFLRLNDLLMKTRKIILFLLIVAVFIIQMSLFYRAFNPSYKDSSIVQEIAGRMKAYPDRTIYTFNIDMGLKAYDVRNEIINLWSSRIGCFKPGSLILINPGNLYRQWKNMNPVYNWEKVKKEYVVVLIEKFPGNWNLYEIKN
jgi:hypothetical protein